MAGLAVNAWELTCYCFIFIVGLFGNLLVCFVVLKSPAEFRFAKFNIYLFALATVDLCLAVVCLPVYLFSTSTFPHPNGYGGTVFCKIFTGYFLPYWMGAASIYILVLISFERFEAVSNPLLSRVRSTKMRIRSNIAFACLSGFYGGPYRSNTIHLSKTQYTYRKHNTFIENKIQLSKTQYTYRKHNTFIENTIHLSKTRYSYRKHNTFIENKIQLSKTQYTY